MGAIRRRLAKEGRGAILTQEELRKAKLFGVYSPLARAKTIREKIRSGEATLGLLANKGKMEKIERRGFYETYASAALASLRADGLLMAGGEKAVERIIKEEKEQMARDRLSSLQHRGFTEADAIASLRRLSANPRQLKSGRLPALNPQLMALVFDAKAKRLGLTKEQKQQMYRLWLIEQGYVMPRAKQVKKGFKLVLPAPKKTASKAAAKSAA